MLKLSEEDVDLFSKVSGKDKYGYWRKGKLHIHVIVMLRMGIKKPFPDYMIDHKNQDKEDNKRENLRWVSRSVNLLNTNKLEKRTHCSRNHEYSFTNTGWTLRGTRYCRACCREDSARRRQSII